MAGLDAIKHFDDGGGVSAPSAAANEVEVAAADLGGAPVNVSSKGVTAAPKTSLTAEQTDVLLQNMQDLIDKKTGGWHDFMSGLQGAAAWAVPGLHGQKAVALDLYNKQRAQEMQDVYGMKAQMAALKSQSEQTKALREADKASGWAPGVAGAPGAAAPADIDPQDLAYYNMLMNAGRVEEALKFKSTRLQDIGKARAGQKYSPSMYDIVEVSFRKPDGSLGTRQALRSEAIQVLGPQEANTLPKVAASAPTFQGAGNAAATAQSLGIPVISGDRDIKKQTELYNASLQPGYAGPPVAKPGSSQHNFGNAIDVDAKKMTPEIAQTLRDNGFVQPLPKTDPNHWELAGARAPQQAPYQVASTKPVPAPAAAPAPTALPSTSAFGAQPIAPRPAVSGPIDIAEARAAGEIAKETQLAKIEGEKELSRGGGKASNELLRFADEASRLRPLLKKVREHSEAYPDEFAVAAKPGTSMGAATWLGQFQGGPEGRAFVEENLPSTLIRPGAKERRDETASAATQIGIKAIPDMFSGNGSVRVGAQISNLVQSGKGLGLGLSAEANTQFSKIAEIGLDRAEMMANALKDLRKTNPRATVDDLPQSTLWKIDDWTEKQFENRGVIAKLPPKEAAAEELRKRKIRGITQ